MAEQRLMLDDGSLVDLLDRLVDTGVVVDGNVIIALAGVDLIRLDLRALVAALATLADGSAPPPPAVAGGSTSTPAKPSHRDATSPRPSPDDTPHPTGPGAPNRPTDGTSSPKPPKPPKPPMPALSARTAGGRAGSDPADIVGRLGHQLGQAQNQAGVAGLVVVLVDLIRQLLQRQALRRMDAGNLTDNDVERLGRALMSLQQQVADLVEVLDLRPPAAGDRR